ncbi:hypothetical protein [Trinickia sp. Y13]|uniref:hypothetical protein n=1 Tax=Trinickia sp. Y13 TaxID=2917807 RepID=UPI002405E697|nr:hypothetical protein [Trinickia sp. Y13]MDG0022771.1 hypothetical protein [Trinickia sp. Y13]
MALILLNGRRALLLAHRSLPGAHRFPTMRIIGMSASKWNEFSISIFNEIFFAILIELA